MIIIMRIMVIIFSKTKKYCVSIQGQSFREKEPLEHRAGGVLKFVPETKKHCFGVKRD